MLEAQALRLRAGGSARGRLLVEGLTFEVKAGECWAVLGPNGAGKSSLLAALAGLHPVDGGDVRLHGRALAAWSGEALADHRAWLPQFTADPFASTVRQTAALARNRGDWWPRTDAGEAAVDAVLERLDLAALADRDVRRLSGGERQRVALATTLLQGAPLLLLDEPSSHLDLAHQQLLLEVLRGHAGGGGAVVASLHDLQLAADLASHAVLIDGRGNALAGSRARVLTPAALSGVFGVHVETLDWHGRQRFFVG